MIPFTIRQAPRTSSCSQCDASAIARSKTANSRTRRSSPSQYDAATAANAHTAADGEPAESRRGKEHDDGDQQGNREHQRPVGTERIRAHKRRRHQARGEHNR